MIPRTRVAAAGALGALALLAGPAGPATGQGAAGDAPTYEERIAGVVRSSALASEITVIRLYHRDAEEMAETLRGILPPEVTVVPDVPTNSLIVSRPLRPGPSR